ncbi:hypothetical protein KOR42_52960 [Thalassoglobus neptunius]|uniref:Uncharacterized protein n=1 Tax=Thalassoglobus neptunius TaxID=1938619 RepID=A0A5C5VAZ6_9PLAN|nr:hypothetical protein [Thalassoglobus neptunius]TWT35029.1 hypothetical protein KOR42_52960 [Thalassoglobus neptunius]
MNIKTTCFAIVAATFFTTHVESQEPTFKKGPGVTWRSSLAFEQNPYFVTSDGRELIYSNPPNGWSLYSLNNGKPVAALAIKMKDFNGLQKSIERCHIRYSEKLRTFLWMSGDSIKLYDVNKDQVRSIEHKLLDSIGLSEDGTKVAGHSLRNIAVYDIQTGKQQHQYRTPSNANFPEEWKVATAIGFCKKDTCVWYSNGLESYPRLDPNANVGGGDDVGIILWKLSQDGPKTYGDVVDGFDVKWTNRVREFQWKDYPIPFIRMSSLNKKPDLREFEDFQLQPLDGATKLHFGIDCVIAVHSLGGQRPMVISRIDITGPTPKLVMSGELDINSNNRLWVSPSGSYLAEVPFQNHAFRVNNVAPHQEVNIYDTRLGGKQPILEVNEKKNPPVLVFNWLSDTKVDLGSDRAVGNNPLFETVHQVATFSPGRIKPGRSLNMTRASGYGYHVGDYEVNAPPRKGVVKVPAFPNPANPNQFFNTFLTSFIPNLNLNGYYNGLNLKKKAEFDARYGIGMMDRVEYEKFIIWMLDAMGVKGEIQEPVDDLGLSDEKFQRVLKTAVPRIQEMYNEDDKLKRFIYKVYLEGPDKNRQYNRFFGKKPAQKNRKVGKNFSGDWSCKTFRVQVSQQENGSYDVTILDPDGQLIERFKDLESNGHSISISNTRGKFRFSISTEGRDWEETDNAQGNHLKFALFDKKKLTPFPHQTYVLEQAEPIPGKGFY